MRIRRRRWRTTTTRAARPSLGREEFVATSMRCAIDKVDLSTEVTRRSSASEKTPRARTG